MSRFSLWRYPRKLHCLTFSLSLHEHRCARRYGRVGRYRNGVDARAVGFQHIVISVEVGIAGERVAHEVETRQISFIGVTQRHTDGIGAVLQSAREPKGDCGFIGVEVAFRGLQFREASSRGFTVLPGSRRLIIALQIIFGIKQIGHRCHVAASRERQSYQVPAIVCAIERTNVLLHRGLHIGDVVNKLRAVLDD